VVGFAVQSFTNGTLVVGGVNVLANYGGNFVHKYVTLINWPRVMTKRGRGFGPALFLGAPGMARSALFWLACAWRALLREWRRVASPCDVLRLRVPLARLLLRTYHANVMGRAAAKVWRTESILRWRTPEAWRII